VYSQLKCVTDTQSDLNSGAHYVTIAKKWFGVVRRSDRVQRRMHFRDILFVSLHLSVRAVLRAAVHRITFPINL